MANPAIKVVKLGRFVTDPGLSLFGSGNTPSQFDANKVEGTIILDQAGKDRFQAWLDEKLTKEVLAEVGLKASDIESVFKEDVDKDKNPTGNWRVKGKSSITYMPKFIGGDGVEFHPEPGFKIPNRATIQLSLGVEVMKMSTFKGLVLRLQGTKILEVPDYGTGFEDDDTTGSFTYSSGDTSGNTQAQPSDEDEIPW